MKSILISVPPKQVAKILRGEKTIEIRKTIPKNWKDYISGKTKAKPEPMTGYIYCTKTIKPLSDYDWGDFTFEDLPKLGKVVACFTLREVEEFCIAPFGDELSEEEERICSESCLSLGELVRHLRDGMFGYAYHVSDLEILKEPKKPSEFKYRKKYHGCKRCPYGKEYNPASDFSVCYTCSELLKVTRIRGAYMYVEEE